MGKRILVAVIFVPILFAIMMFLPALVWTAVIAGIAALAAHELLRATGERCISLPMQVASILASIIIPFGCYFGWGNLVFFLCAFLVLSTSFWCAIRAYDEENAKISLYHVLLTVFAGVLIPAALSSLVMLRNMVLGRYLVLFTVLLAFITDGGAYFAGVFLGKHRQITKVSPNKSLEGYIGGFITGVIFAVLFGFITGAITGAEINYLALGLCGFFGALVTEFGDLVFSLIKRQYSVKDYGNLLPGHGGMLDRFDSMLFCGPVVLFIATFLPIFEVIG